MSDNALGVALALIGSVAMLTSHARAMVVAEVERQTAVRHTAADDLLAADRAFSARAASTTGVAALSAMFLPDVIMPGPAGLAEGRDAVVAALRAAAETADARLEWTPIGVGVSGDGHHGYTFGFMTARAPDGGSTPLKYMAYWIRQPSGWRVAGYKRARRPEGTVSLAPWAPDVPSASAAVVDTARVEADRRSLVAAEQAFSDRAQTVGLGRAFAEFGAPTAVNMGGPASAGFIVGAGAIGAHIGAGAPGATSPVFWSSETVLVASSGDLGISFGYIRAHAPPPGAPPKGQAFFTIWRRSSLAAPWRYVAE